MTFEELQKIVYDAGIVGAGGAGFPTHRKFSDKVKQIIVNAAECEPLMMVDHHILEHHLQALVDTLNVLIDTMGADEAIIGKTFWKKGNFVVIAPFGYKNCCIT